jgi:DNA-binding PadR family transcriptional regulator
VGGLLRIVRTEPFGLYGSLSPVSRDLRLTDTSYVVLGLVEVCQPATPYDLKQFARISVFNFWSVPHTQVYSECARLAEAGLLDEEREEGGRRRRVYRLTTDGQRELDDWRQEPPDGMLELRDPGLLKLFFGADPAQIAAAQLEAHQQRLAEYEELHSAGAGEMAEGMRLALESGMGHEREFVRFWGAIHKRRPPQGGRSSRRRRSR